ncbi:NAD(P)/FAD-dependent oxidoreductase [Bacillus sp. EB106-08-02-XG196]|uniref:phytoene desaturase family protein n=1 Tax=Bacillus sp. EB106-08-02-XG196 TaxID=2737049 RepID=UPI0015C4E036|nr:FAD-dependent oxidoreductase [Bacillus sp. EB106-08-02-XG196]NWQ41734.1 NAD(P)/FAD-dependent oxidoreductase [Bacillus sp. EB106-08-02-XG196]
MTKKWDVVIVGGGLAGYVAANYLAKSNLSVLIVEKGKKVGGRARTDLIRQQYFNLGPHALYKKGKAKYIFEELDIQLNGRSPKTAGILVESNMEYQAPFSPLGLLTTRLLNWKERMEWARVLLKVMVTDTGKLEHQTFNQWVQLTACSEKIQSLLYSLGRLATYCHAPEKASAKVIVSHLKAVFGGVLYIDYGWQTIIDQLHNKAVILGIQVQNHTSVKQIDIIEQGHFRLVLTHDKEIFAKNVIYTAGPTELYHMFDERALHSQNDFLANMLPIKGATLDVALTHLPNPENLFALGLSEPLYFSVHSNYAQLSSDNKSAVLHVFKYYLPGEQINETSVKKELEQFLGKIQPGWQNYLITSRFIPQIKVNQRLPQVGDEQMLHRLKAEIPGLYLAGDWASRDSILLEGAVNSGKQAAEEILKKEKS